MRIHHLKLAALCGLTLALGACGDSDEAADAEGGSAINRELAEEGLDFDASTMDAMSVDVVAGGTPPATDPETADAGIDMTPDRPAAEDAETTENEE